MKAYYDNSEKVVGSKTSYTFKDLEEGKKYYIAVRAYDTDNKFSYYSEEVVYTVPILDDLTAPSTPVIFLAHGISTSQINLIWSASTDNLDVKGYKIYRSGSLVADVSSTTYQDTGLSLVTTYAYTVSAYDASGNESSKSAPVSAADTIPPGSPSGMIIVE